MHNPILTVVLSQGQSRNPEKRGLEEGIIAAASKLLHTRVVVVPHLYDLPMNGESMTILRNIQGPMIVCSWLFERAAHWVLDRNQVRGQIGEVLLIADEEDEEDEEDQEELEKEQEPRVADQFPRPNRFIYCVDLRVRDSIDPFIEEIQRIHAICRDDATSEKLTQNEPTDSLSVESRARFLSPTNSTALAIDSSGKLALDFQRLEGVPSSEPVLTIDEHPGRRWYPVIDFSRCTNCMECIDFCLFGVYGVDQAETILVEQPDNCRKGCPACSRVCPSNAIIFPQHKTPAIAGAAVDAGGLKIDLSKLFGAPERNEDPLAAAARERDEQLILAGRSAVGIEMKSEEPKESNVALAPSKPKDAFDQLIDQLDSLDL